MTLRGPLCRRRRRRRSSTAQLALPEPSPPVVHLDALVQLSEALVDLLRVQDPLQPRIELAQRFDHGRGRVAFGVAQADEVVVFGVPGAGQALGEGGFVVAGARADGGEGDGAVDRAATTGCGGGWWDEGCGASWRVRGEGRCC